MFEVGDFVRVIKVDRNRFWPQYTGTVGEVIYPKALFDGGTYVGVDFYPWGGGHSLRGKLTGIRSNSGAWYAFSVANEYLEFCEKIDLDEVL